ncbi:porphobilinogen synthase [Seinonella peptonophila]|uniref:Delta-aminolevulinic acid dehydratase n=1 Tax=Seinonella peptonophila TaxID=112248 RepID=A0A1M4TUL9_9BACL|nr:porphobilinogen synthase [Seinonella peptonophila]SHE48116.1 porphobilinogen synthase [Seinonella peptonophila]
MNSFIRHRRLRRNDAIRTMIREHHVRVDDLIYPLFVVEGKGMKNEIHSMPGIYQYSLDQLETELNELMQLGILSIMVFGVPLEKDEQGSQAYHSHGIVQEAIRWIKERFPQFYVIADTCLCQYTSHGHCGVVENGEVLNDPSLSLLAATAVSQAEAGADMIAPSNMMDGFVAEIRLALDQHGYEHIPILSYAVKYASGYYGPFRDAAQSKPQFGDRRSYQMDPANAREAMREATSDIAEGADLLMVKPGLAYLDIIYRVREAFSLPIVAYNVSGEYAMVKAAAKEGWIDERKVVEETLVGFKRAGADLILTYHAKDMANWLKG